MARTNKPKILTKMVLTNKPKKQSVKKTPIIVNGMLLKRGKFSKYWDEYDKKRSKATTKNKSEVSSLQCPLELDKWNNTWRILLMRDTILYGADNSINEDITLNIIDI